jgi:hypothetical protein
MTADRKAASDADHPPTGRRDLGTIHRNEIADAALAALEVTP